MTQEAKTIIGIGVVTLTILVMGVIFLTKNSSSSSSKSRTQPDTDNVFDQATLIRSDSEKLGSDSAKVKIVEFGDYQCPACGQAYPDVKRMTQDYEGKIELVFRNFPLPQHHNAPMAAEAAEEAGIQGKFWPMHDKLYETQSQWSDLSNPLDTFTQFGQSLNLNLDQFKTDVSNNKFQDNIQQGISDGNSVGVSATPTFFINGKRYTGVLSYDDFKAIIDPLLNSP